MGDLFHKKVDDFEIAAVFGVMAACPQHSFQVLTKRPERMNRWFQTITERDVAAQRYLFVHKKELAMWNQTKKERPPVIPWPLPNVLLGVSVEDQKTADERIPLLLETPAAMRFVSAEPLLDSIDFTRLRDDELGAKWNALSMGISWIICGSESGPKARRADVTWFRHLRDQCAAAGTPFFLKQMHVDGKLHKMPKLDGVVHDAYPKTLP
jgi:protein gp37